MVLFICDGLSVDLVERGCAEGWLPNFRDRFMKAGTRVENAVTCVPSITYAVLTTFASGVTPARHGIVANEWFDPRLRLWREYGMIKHYRDVNGDFHAPTLYELMLPKISVSIQSAVHRGVTKNVANWAQSGVRWFYHDYTAVDKLTATTIEYVADWANENAVWPDLLVCYFPGLDSVGHAFGVNSERYRAAAVHADYQVGRICDWLESSGLLETTTLILVSDHGMASVADDGYVDLLKTLRRDMGRRVTEQPCQGRSFESRYRHFERYDTVLARSAVRFAAIHFRGKLGWNDPLDASELRAILEMPAEGGRLWDHSGVALAAYLANDREVVLRTPRGSARIEERATPAGLEYRYLPTPNDVLGYLCDAALAEFVEQGYHGSREWLDATRDQTYPDIVPHLAPLLHQPRAGDVVLFAARGYSFGKEKSGHGGIHRDEMRIPMFFAGPGIEAGGVIDKARAVDLAPTIMELFGGQVADGVFEGRPVPVRKQP